MYVAAAHADRDSRARSSAIEQQMAIAQSSTLYIGNLSFYTTEEQMYELFARVTHVVGGGGIKRIIMGLDRNTKTPCGFAFVEYVGATDLDFIRTRRPSTACASCRAPSSTSVLSAATWTPATATVASTAAGALAARCATSTARNTMPAARLGPQ